MARGRQGGETGGPGSSRQGEGVRGGGDTPAGDGSRAAQVQAEKEQARPRASPWRVGSPGCPEQRPQQAGRGAGPQGPEVARQACSGAAVTLAALTAGDGEGVAVGGHGAVGARRGAGLHDQDAAGTGCGERGAGPWAPALCAPTQPFAQESCSLGPPAPTAAQLPLGSRGLRLRAPQSLRVLSRGLWPWGVRPISPQTRLLCDPWGRGVRQGSPLPSDRCGGSSCFWVSGSRGNARPCAHPCPFGGLESLRKWWVRSWRDTGSPDGRFQSLPSPRGGEGAGAAGPVRPLGRSRWLGFCAHTARLGAAQGSRDEGADSSEPSAAGSV